MTYSADDIERAAINQKPFSFKTFYQDGTRFEIPESVGRLMVGPTSKNYLEFEERLFAIMRKMLPGIDIAHTNLYKIKHTGIDSLPAITITKIRGVPYDSPKPRRRHIREASETIEGAEVHGWGVKMNYTIQFDCWAESEQDAEYGRQLVEDLFLRKGNKILEIGVQDFRLLEELTDITIVRYELPYSVRSMRFQFIMSFLEAETVPEIGQINVTLLEPPEED
jgi:hypothetical protein